VDWGYVLPTRLGPDSAGGETQRPSPLFARRNWVRGTVMATGYKSFEVCSGKRRVSLRRASTAAEAVIDYLRSMGCRDDEMMRVGMDAVTWRGAIYRAVPAPPVLSPQ
jgi:hypothetical protein